MAEPTQGHQAGLGPSAALCPKKSVLDSSPRVEGEAQPDRGANQPLIPRPRTLSLLPCRKIGRTAAGAPRVSIASHQVTGRTP